MSHPFRSLLVVGCSLFGRRRIAQTNNKQRTTNNLFVALPVFAALFLGACQSDPNSPGLEYMPDMYRSPAIEAYVDYGQDPYYFGDSASVAQRMTQSAKLPPVGTIPFAGDQSKAMYNFPYPFADTPADYERAGLELHSPIAFTQESVDKGKVIYTKFCVHCHGEKGDGDGAVVTKGGHAPPTAYSGPLKDLPEGKAFHTVTYGKGMMGSHASQLNKEERWLVVQYVKFLQNGGKLTAGAAAPADSTTTATAPPAK